MVSDTLKLITDAARAMLEAERERDPVPEAILRYAATRAGKPVTKKDCQAIVALFPGLDVGISKDDFSAEIVYYLNCGGMENGKPVFSDFVRWDGPNEVRDPEQPTNCQHLYDQGVPLGWGNASRIKIRASKWADPDGGSGVTRWPDVATIRGWNARYFDARDQRNAARDQSLASIEGPNDCASLASLVDEMALMAGEIRGYLEHAPPEVSRVVRDILKSADITLDNT